MVPTALNVGLIAQSYGKTFDEYAVLANENPELRAIARNGFQFQMAMPTSISFIVSI